MRDSALWDVIRAIPQQTQRQYATDEQLLYLMAAANKLGLYDAADRIRNGLEASPKPHVCTTACGPEQPEGEDWRDVRALRDMHRGTHGD